MRTAVLTIAIADVAAYVRPGTALDREAELDKQLQGLDEHQNEDDLEAVCVQLLDAYVLPGALHAHEVDARVLLQPRLAHRLAHDAAPGWHPQADQLFLLPTPRRALPLAP